VFACYNTKAPISPSTQCQLYDLAPRKKQEVQMEYSDDGLYFRHEHDWKFKPFGKNEGRFDYAKLSNAENNQYQLKHHKSTCNWHSPWQLHLTDQNEMYAGEGTLVPAYSSLSDPYCAKFVQKLYNVPAFDEPAENEDDLAFYKRREETCLTNKFFKGRRSSCAVSEARPDGPESAHDFYKRREEQGSNAFQRARRRSIELIDQVSNNMKAPTASSRRKSVVCYDPPVESGAGGATPDEDDTMDHAAAAREATRKFFEDKKKKGEATDFAAEPQYPMLVHVDSMLDPPSPIRAPTASRESFEPTDPLEHLDAMLDSPSSFSQPSDGLYRQQTPTRPSRQIKTPTE